MVEARPFGEVKIHGPDAMREALFSFASRKRFVRRDNPLRKVKTLVDDALIGVNDQFKQICPE